MAEEDGDESFGDFTFASMTTPTLKSTEISTADNADDDWGDFTFIQHPTPDNIKSPPQPQPQPVKIKGALPLSIFGEEEEEEVEEEVVNTGPPVHPPAADVKESSFSGNNVRPAIDDLLANLYGQREQQIVNSDNGGLESSLEFITPNSSAVLDLSSSAGNGFKNKIEHSFSKSETDRELISRLDTVPSGDQESDDDDDDQGWEFRAAPTNTKVAGNGNDKEYSKEAVSPLGLQDGSHGPIDLFAARNGGVSAESHEMDNRFDSKPITMVQTGHTMQFKTEWKGAANGLNSNPLGGSVDSDKNIGEFETAFTESPLKQKEFPQESNFGLGSRDALQAPIDLFALSNGVPAESFETNNGFDFNPSTVIANGVTSDTCFQTEGKASKSSLDSQLLGVHADTNESFGEFTTAFQEGGSKQKGNKAIPKCEGAVPLSIFGIEEREDDNHLNLQHKFEFSSSTRGKNTMIQTSKSPINDLFSDLYSQVQPTSSFEHECSPDGKKNEMYSSYKEDGPHIVHDDDNLDDRSWEFQDAFSQPNVENEKFSFKRKLNSWMSFYSNLKDALYVVARSHLHSLKKAHSTATLTGDEMKVAVLDEQIKDAFEELQQENINFGEFQSDDYPQRNTCLKQYIETLHQPDFQVLESEYHISRRLPSAESDLRAAIELIKHSTAMLKILTVVPPFKPADYVSTWYKIISVCAQELKHGAWLWKQSLEKNVQSEILSEPRGKQFILALGEIYRVVVIFGASAKLYKPWMLLSSADLAGFDALLDECYTLWSTSGLDAAASNIKSILESIKQVQDFDALALANEVSQKKSLCQLSLLPPGVVPDMNLVQWDGDSYFLTLANLWANLISRDPPKLSSVDVG